MRWLSVAVYLLIALASVTLAQYGMFPLHTSSAVLGNVLEGNNNVEVPFAPPRVPASRQSLGYRPPPPPLRRSAFSEGKCEFDESKWSIEPQSAIANAVMFDRTTGLSCEECLAKCSNLQSIGTQWVCRTLTYDNRWKICDLFAINGTNYPHFLTEYPGRDYFVFKDARTPTDDEVSGKTEENIRGNAEPEEFGPRIFGAPSGASERVVVETKSAYDVTDLSSLGVTEDEGLIDNLDSIAAGESLEVNDETNSETSDDIVTKIAESFESVAETDLPLSNSSNPLEINESSVKSSKISGSASPKKSIKSTTRKISKVSKSSSKQSKSKADKSSLIEPAIHKQYGSKSKKITKSNVSDDKIEKLVSMGIGRIGASPCDENAVTRYAVFTDKERIIPGVETQLTESATVEECAQSCDENELIACASAEFTSAGCELSTLPVNHRKSGELTPNRNSTYLEKLCLPSALAEKTRKIWPVVSNHILVGHVIEVTDAPSLTDCVIACLRAEEEFGFACKSAMWYPNDEDQNCLLNSESRDTQPDVFVAEDPDVEMIYLDVPRDNSEPLTDSKPTRLRDDPLNHVKSLQYTMWSSCANNATQMRHRYLKCKDRKDVRKCPKETVMCRHPPQALASSECIAVRDSLGRRRCPHGIRILADGRNAYCKNPIDCE